MRPSVPGNSARLNEAQYGRNGVGKMYFQFVDDNGHYYGSFEMFYFRGNHQSESGWYWQAGHPGCLPDADPIGPFETITECLEDARQ